MAKKKDTLKDLNEFMRSQQSNATEDEAYLDKKPTSLAEVERLKNEIKKLEELPAGALHEDELAELIQKIASAQSLNARHILFKICEKVLQVKEDQDSSDIMLLNTILYLQHNDLLVQKLS
jgi:type II secretory pathway component PulM